MNIDIGSEGIHIPEMPGNGRLSRRLRDSRTLYLHPPWGLVQAFCINECKALGSTLTKDDNPATYPALGSPEEAIIVLYMVAWSF